MSKAIKDKKSQREARLYNVPAEVDGLICSALSVAASLDQSESKRLIDSAIEQGLATAKKKMGRSSGVKYETYKFIDPKDPERRLSAEQKFELKFAFFRAHKDVNIGRLTQAVGDMAVHAYDFKFSDDQRTESKLNSVDSKRQYAELLLKIIAVGNEASKNFGDFAKNEQAHDVAGRIQVALSSFSAALEIFKPDQADGEPISVPK